MEDAGSFLLKTEELISLSCKQAQQMSQELLLESDPGFHSCLWCCVSTISWDPYGGELAVLFLKLLPGKDLTTSSDLRQSNFHKDMGDRQGKQVLLG